MTRPRRWTLRKWVLLIYGIVALAATVDCYVLAHVGAEPPSDLATLLVGLFDAAYLGYLGADCLDHNSINKYGAQDHSRGADNETEGDQ